MKDNGLVPYLLFKEHGCDSTMVGINNGGYDYLDSYLTGLKMEFIQTGSVEEKSAWIAKNANDIDILIVNSIYPTSLRVAEIYKLKNPSGLTYMPLDANSHWMDRVDFRDPKLSNVLDKIDVIGTSGRSLAEYLNKKWPWLIEFFPNGLYNPLDKKMEEVSYDEKENIILTVGRLGTRQKATEILLNAFARFSYTMPNWKLHLIGSIEESFNDYIEDFFISHPQLKSRLFFLGQITDKEALFKEYRRAKIFCMTSILEGGTPNVISEALWCGCAVATTEYDSFNDSINEGKCGKSVPIDDVIKMAEILTEMASDETWLKNACHNAYVYANTDLDMRKIVSRIYESLMEVGFV